MTSENSVEQPIDDSDGAPRRSMHFPNENLLASGSPFVDDNGRNPFADNEPQTAIDVESSEDNAYVANYAAAAATAGEFEIRLKHRGGTLMLVAIFSAIMTGLSTLIGPALWVVGMMGLWVFFSALSDLNAMKIGRMNHSGRGQTRVALFLSGTCLIIMVGSVVRVILWLF